MSQEYAPMEIVEEELQPQDMGKLIEHNLKFYDQLLEDTNVSAMSVMLSLAMTHEIYAYEFGRPALRAPLKREIVQDMMDDDSVKERIIEKMEGDK